jgi:hypothetical protein
LNSTGTNGFGGLRGTVYSSNGAPVISNNFLLDGTQIANQSNWGTASFAGTTLGVDGIQEYKVLTSTYDASYGMTMGSEMVMISKGGANQFHGDIFEYLRNSALNARNFFDGPKIPQLEKNNFGAAFGGPIRKDKAFFYAVYEGLQENFGFTANDLVPEAGCHGAAGAVITGAACPTLGLAPGSSVTIANANIAAMLSLYPNPNNGTNSYLFGPSTKVEVNHGQIRFDHNFSSSDSFFARYTIDSASIDSANNQGMPVPSGTAFPQFRGGGYDFDQFITRNHHGRDYLLALAIARSTQFGAGAGGRDKNRTRRKACERNRQPRSHALQEGNYAAGVGRSQRTYSRDGASPAQRGNAIRRVRSGRTRYRPPSGNGRSRAAATGADEPHDEQHRRDEGCEWDARTHCPVAARGGWPGVALGH